MSGSRRAGAWPSTRNATSGGLGDWALEGLCEYGDVVEAAGEIGIDYGALRNLMSVARKVPLSRRNDNLSWSHHAAVAALPADTADALLARAEAERWPREIMREEAREASELHRLRSENKRLRQALAEAGTSRAAARRTERQVRDGCKAAVRTYRDLAAVVREAASSPALQALHGNARTALAIRLEQVVRAAGADTAEVIGETLVPAIGELREGGEVTPAAEPA